MADNNSKKPMALLLLVVVAVLVVILMTPPVNCTGTCKGDSSLDKVACETAGKTWEEVEIHVQNLEDCKGTYWDLSKEDGCIAAGKSWTPGNPGDPTATPPIEATNGECK